MLPEPNQSVDVSADAVAQPLTSRRPRLRRIRTRAPTLGAPPRRSTARSRSSARCSSARSSGTAVRTITLDPYRNAPVGRARTPDEQQRLFAMAQDEASLVVCVRGGHPLVLLRHARLRNQGAPLAGHRLAQPSAPHPAIEDPGRLAITHTQRDVRAGASTPPRPGRRARVHRGRALRVPLARSRETHRSDARHDVLAQRLAVDPNGRGTGYRALPRWSPHRHHDTYREGTSGLGDPSAGGSRRARDDEDLQPHPPSGAQSGRRRARTHPSAVAPAPRPEPPRQRREPRVMSHATSQNARLRGRVLRFAKEDWLLGLDSNQQPSG